MPSVLTRRATTTATTPSTWSGSGSAEDPETLERWLEEWVYGLAPTPSTSRSWATRTGTRCGPAHALSGEVDYGSTRDPGTLRTRTATPSRDDDRARARALAGVAPASSASACRTSSATLPSARSRPICSSSTRPGSSARGRRLPLSIGDPTLVTGATAVTTMFELFAFYLQAGLIDVGVPRRGADRSLRQPEHHRDRRLRRAQDAPAGQRRRLRDRDPRPAADHHAAGRRAFVERLDFQTSPWHSGDPTHDGRWVGGRRAEARDRPRDVRLRQRPAR